MIRVYLDDEDKEKWQEVTKGSLNKDAFFREMIDKYNILYNKKLAISQTQGFIFEWETVQELAKYR